MESVPSQAAMRDNGLTILAVFRRTVPNSRSPHLRSEHGSSAGRAGKEVDKRRANTSQNVRKLSCGGPK